MRTAWPTVPLGEVSTSRLGKMLSPAAKAGSAELPYLGNAEVRWGSLQLEDLRTMTFTPEEQVEFSLRAGDVLICEGGEVGRCAVVPEDLPGVHFQKAIHRVRCGERLSPHYLYRYMRYAAVTGRLDDVSSQATIKHLTGVKLRTLPVPLPPIEEQRRIAALLDAADALRAKRRQTLGKLDTLTQAIFVDMFGDPFSPDSPTVALAEVADIVMGQSPPGASYNMLGDGTPLLNGPSEFGERTPTAVQWTTAPTRLSEENDILFCVRGATAGRLNWADGEYCLGRGLAGIRAPETRREFLFRILDAYYPRFQAKGVGSTFINISKRDLYQLPVPAATDSDASLFGRLQSRLNQLRSEVDRAARAEDVLFTSLQQRAFRGEL